MARRSQTKVLTDTPEAGPYEVIKFPVTKQEPSNVVRIDNPDGTITVDFDPKPEPTGEQNDNEFTENLALRLEDIKLSEIATDLLDGIDRDENSRKDWLQTRTRGIELLGLKLKTPRSDTGTAVEGMSGIDHPMLLEATINFQATARAELLPAGGPCKVRNDNPVKPPEIQETSAKPALEASLASLDALSQALERDMNHYLTVTATEYVPDTDRMLFYVGFGGDGFKKVYNCPLRRRPVSESVDAEDLIVSNASTDLKNCGRVTHRIKMRPSVLKRMQIIGAYRDVTLEQPQVVNPNEADKKKNEIEGFNPSLQRPKDREYELYETYCELDLDQFAPEKFKGKGLPLPYRVTLERQSKQVLDIRRNWDEKDEEALPKQFFVQFPFIRGLGFYGLGYIHILGNTTVTLTAAWREMIDAGMYASFPGFIYEETIGRQLNNEFRVPPGGGVPLKVGPNKKLQDSIMPVPYKEVGAGFTSFITHVEEVGRRLATSGNVAVGEGKQDAPVGTTLALIEQATKAIDSAHKRLYAAQGEELRLFKERFKEDPEAFWRFNKNPAHQWQKDQFITALNDSNLVPVADPNNPTSLHRIAKAVTIKELQKVSPEIYDKVAVDMRVMQITNIDPQGLFLPKETPPPPDPRMEAIKEKAQAAERQANIQLADSVQRHETEKMKLLDKERDRRSRERLEAMRIELERIKMFTEGMEKNQQAYADAKAREQEIYEQYALETLKEHMEAARSDRQEERDAARELRNEQREAARQSRKDDQDFSLKAHAHILDTREERLSHDLDLEHDMEKHREKLANDKEIAKIKEKNRPKPAKKKTTKKAKGGAVEGDEPEYIKPAAPPLDKAYDPDKEDEDED